MNIAVKKNLTFVKIYKDTIIDWISDIWWDPNLITSSMIKYSFKVTGITNSLDKSEDYMFNVFDKIKSEIVVQKDIDENNEIALNSSEDENS